MAPRTLGLKAVRSAIYNTVALAILGVVTLLSSSVYLYVLQPYLRPLLWAGLCGSVLYPLKEKVAMGLRSWTVSVQSSKKPAVVEACFLPFVIVDSSYEFCLRMLSSHAWNLATTTLGFTSYVVFYYWAPAELGQWWEKVQLFLKPLSGYLSPFGIYFVS